MDVTLDNLVEISKECLKEYNIDYGMLQMDEKSVIPLISSQVLEHMNNIDKEEREIILMASLVTLIVENTILHLKLTQLGNKNEIYNFL